MKNAEAVAQDAAVQIEGICHAKGYNRSIIEPVLLEMIQSRDADHENARPDVIVPAPYEESPIIDPEPTEA